MKSSILSFVVSAILLSFLSCGDKDSGPTNTPPASLWSKITTGFSMPFASFFRTPTVGFIATAASSIKKTTDGGSTWTNQTSPSTSGIQSIFFIDENKGFGVGASETIIATTNGGVSWVVPRALSSIKNIPFTILVCPAGVSPAEQVTFYLQNEWRKAGIKSQDIPLATELHRIVAHYYSTGSEHEYQTAQKAVNRFKTKYWFRLLNKPDYRVEIPDSAQLPTPKQLSRINKSNPDEYAFYRTRQNWYVDSTLYQSITSPVLMIYGGKDELVPTEQSMIIFQRAYAQNQNTDVTFRIYENSGHAIQPVGKPYLSEGYREYMAEWIRSRVRSREKK